MASNPTVDEIVSGTAAVLQAIAGPLPGGGAGVVFDEPIHTITQDEFKDTFLDSDDQLRGTDIELGVPEEFEDEAGHKFWNIWPVRIRHYRHISKDKSSYREFWNEVQAIKDTLRKNTSIFGIPHRPEVQRVGKVESVDEFFFGNILCHRAVIVADVETEDVP
jgi:hypothetical protein